MTTYGGESNLQKIFWGELSEILARNNIDTYDESVSRLVRFILDLPKNKKVSEEDMCRPYTTGSLNGLYKSFRRICSQEYTDIETSTTSLHIFFR